MGILESLFEGSDSIVSRAFQFFGTTATLYYREENAGSPSGSGSPEGEIGNDTAVDVLFIPEKISESDLVRENGLGSKRSVLSGIIRTTGLPRVPRSHIDSIHYRNIRYRITEVHQELIGDTGTIVSITAIR
ncbi:MAG: hypothetical protein Q4G69_00855 [Planctomycetia bacterium]|nr:hypothetical protein [Planctomycetia bacterium]